MIVEEFGESAGANATCKNWYKRSRCLKDSERPGRFEKFEDEERQHPLDQNSTQAERKGTTRNRATLVFP
jgi:hypothetical protein